MNKQNLAYITNLEIEDVPWSRLTTTYGRASEFPEIFKQLSAAIGEKNLTQSLTTSKSNNSFYFYSRTVLDTTGVDFKQFKPIE